MTSPSPLDPKNQQPNQQFQDYQEPTPQFQENQEQVPQIDPSHSLNVSSQDFQNPLQSDQNNDTQQAVGPENPPEIVEPAIESGVAASELVGEGQVQIQHQQNAHCDQQNLGFQGLSPAAAAAAAEATLSQLTQFAGNMDDVERALVELQGLIAAGGLGALIGGGGAAPFISQGPMHYCPIRQPPYRGGGRRGVDRYRRGGRGSFGNHGRGRWTPRQNSQQISSSGPVNIAAETTKSVEEVAEALAVNIDQAGQVEMPYQASVQPNVTSAPQRHMQVAHCELCRVDCISFEILEQHKGGKRHKKNIQRLEALKAYQPGPVNIVAETTKSVEEVAEALAVNIDQAGQVEMPYQASVQPNVTSAPQRHMQLARCELCRVDCNSFEILEQHKGGKRHKKNIQRLEALKAYQAVSNVRSNGQNGDSNTEGKLEPENMQNAEENKQTIPENFHSEALPVQNNLENQPQNPEIHQFDNQRPGMKRKMIGGHSGRKRTNTQRWPKEPKVVVPLICDLCNVMCDTQEVLDRHLSGKKHISKYKRFEGHQAMYGPAELQVLYPPNPISQTLSQPQGHQQNFSVPQGLNLLPPGAHATPQIHSAGAPNQALDGNPDYQQNFSAPQGSNLLPPGAPTGSQVSRVHKK